MTCSCHVTEHDQQTEPEIVYCPLHAAAPELREALREVIAGYPFFASARGLLDRLNRIELDERRAEARAAKGGGRIVAVLALALAIQACSAATMPAPGQLGDDGWRVWMYRLGSGPAVVKPGGPRTP